MDQPFDTKTVTEVVLQNDIVLIIFSEADSCVFLKWKRQITFDERKETFLWAYEFSKQHHVKSWLIDDEEIFIITSAEKNWITNDFTQIVSDAGIEKIAVYLPEEAYNAIITNTEFTRKAQQNYKQHGVTEHEVFTDFQTAMLWLRS